MRTEVRLAAILLSLLTNVCCGSGGAPGGTTPIAAAPVVTTETVSAVNAVAATGGGTVTDEGTAAVSVRGICWSTAQGPTTADSKTVDGSGAGSFSSSLTGLSPRTVYYLRAYASNSVDTAYGSEVSFTTSSQVNGGTTISPPPSYTVSITGPITLHYGTPSIFSYTYTGTAGSCAWYIDDSGAAVGSAFTLSITPTVSTYAYGAHLLMLVITDTNGFSYSGTLAISVQN
jgi:hypothetical protein